MKRTREAGFVITLEFLLVMAIVVLPLFIGFILLARKTYTLYLNQREAVEMPYSKAVVWDSSSPAQVIGQVIGYDAFEAPLIFFRDSETKGGVVLGVRRFRFTSLGEVYYSGGDCTGTPYLRQWDSEVGTGPGYAAPPVGFTYQLQGASYAMGRPNVLYRSLLTPGVNGTGLVQSVWRSQDFTPPASDTPPPPCFTVDGSLVDNLVAATPVIDFDGVLVSPANSNPYQTPYKVALPTPVAPPSPMACPTGECP